MKAIDRIVSGGKRILDWVASQSGWKKGVAVGVASIFIALVPATYFVFPVGVTYTMIFTITLYYLGKNA